MQQYGTEDEMHFTGSGWKLYMKIDAFAPSINMSNMTV